MGPQAMLRSWTGHGGQGEAVQTWSARDRPSRLITMTSRLNSGAGLLPRGLCNTCPLHCCSRLQIQYLLVHSNPRVRWSKIHLWCRRGRAGSKSWGWVLEGLKCTSAESVHKQSKFDRRRILSSIMLRIIKNRAWWKPETGSASAEVLKIWPPPDILEAIFRSNTSSLRGMRRQREILPKQMAEHLLFHVDACEPWPFLRSLVSAVV
jgi:hypothetical protein